MPSRLLSSLFEYVVGSAGFLPVVDAWSPLVGILGFVLGSAFIGGSELWKLHRISRGADGSFGSRDAATATCVEGGACAGGWGFFFGTLLYWAYYDALVGAPYMAVLALWLVGSTAFTFGGLSLAYRHFVMGVV